MPTTFSVFSLGVQQVWDPTEGDQSLSTSAVNSTLGTYGSSTDPLFDSIQTLSPAGNGFGGGSSNSYDLDNTTSNDQFSLDGGAAQTMDAAMVFNAVITYKNGGVATITAVVFQDANGATYWAPEFSSNADQAAIEAAAIESLQLVSPIYAQGVNGQGYGLFADRVDSDLICFARGASIACPEGERPVETLSVGDLVLTKDHGPQTVRWIGKRTVAATGSFAPICIKAGAYGARRDLEVSPQHRLLLSSPQLHLLCGAPEGLAAAKHLVDNDRVVRRERGSVDYYHLLFDAHEIIWANGAPVESLFFGDAGWRSVGIENLAEFLCLFPDMADRPPADMQAARPVLKAHEARLAADRPAPPTRSRRIPAAPRPSSPRSSVRSSAPSSVQSSPYADAANSPLR